MENKYKTESNVTLNNTTIIFTVASEVLLISILHNSDINKRANQMGKKVQSEVTLTNANTMIIITVAFLFYF